MKLLSKFKSWVKEISEGPIDWEDLEATLIQSDLGFELVDAIIDRLKEKALSAENIQQAVIEEISSLWSDGLRSLDDIPSGPQVWLIVGVNGVGKTTSTGKLARRYQDKGRKVHLVAADTFRAGAIEQLRIWGQRENIPVTLGKEGGDPSAAAFQGIEQGLNEGADLILIDTAGRLHNKENLMRELEKMKRVIRKKIDTAPHETLLVLDATNGANSINQAQQFHQAVDLTGAIITKLDSSSKGGVVASIKEQFSIDTLMIGTGESASDIKPFAPQTYIQDFFG